MPLKNRKVILAKIESTYGTDPTPVAGTDALLVHDFNFTPVELQWQERTPALPYYGNQGKLKAGEFMRCEFDVEMAGAGGVATVAKYGPVLRACALSETVTPTTGPVTYAPISTGEESVALYYNWDGLQHKMLGARGTVSLRLTAGQTPKLHFSLLGLYGGITDVALPTPTLTGFQKPLVVNKTNTPTCTLHGYAAPLQELVIDYGVANEYVNRPNQEKVHFVGRKVTGAITLEVPSIATKDYFTILRAETTGALAVVHGTAAGNKALIDAATVQLSDPRYSEVNGIGYLQMGLDFLTTSAGNDELTYKTQ